MNLQQIDLLYLRNHCYLSDPDECFYMLSYTSHRPYTYSEDNSIIANLKKDMCKRGLPEWKYKQQAIDRCASFLRSINITNIFSDNITIVPIPPSKIRTDPDHDDRLIQVLNKAFNGTIDIRELITQVHSTEADHTTTNRRPPEEIKRNYIFNEALAVNAKENIIIFDDVVTTGAHYIAAKEIIQENMPNIASIKGLFIARRVFAEDSDPINFHSQENLS